MSKGKKGHKKGRKSRLNFHTQEREMVGWSSRSTPLSVLLRPSLSWHFEVVNFPRGNVYYVGFGLRETPIISCFSFLFGVVHLRLIYNDISTQYEFSLSINLKEIKSHLLLFLFLILYSYYPGNPKPSFLEVWIYKLHSRKLPTNSPFTTYINGPITTFTVS